MGPSGWVDRCERLFYAAGFGLAVWCIVAAPFERGPPRPATTIRVVDEGEDAGPCWLNTASGVRHGPGCRWFERTAEGRHCGPDEGIPCEICGGGHRRSRPRSPRGGFQK